MNPLAGWHADPTNPAIERWWDGAQWTDRTRSSMMSSPVQGYGPPPALSNPERNGLGIAALVLGIVGLLFCLMPLTAFIGFILGVVGVALGLTGVGRCRKNKATNIKTAVIGTGISALAIVFGIVGIAMFFSAVSTLSDELDQINNSLEW